MKKEKSISNVFARTMIFTATAVVLVVTATFSIKYIGIIRKNTELSTTQTVTQTNRHLASYIRDIMQIGTITQNLLDKEECATITSASLETIKESRKDIVTIDIFDTNGTIICGTSGKKIRNKSEIISQEWFKTAIQRKEGLYFTMPHVQQLIPLKYPWVISFSKTVTIYTEEGKREKGIILIDINYSTIENILKSATIGKTGYIYLIDKNGNIVYHPKQELINFGQFREDLKGNKKQIFGSYYSFFGGKERWTIIQTVDSTRWRMVGIAFTDELILKSTQSAIYVLFLIVAISFIAVFFLARLIAEYLTSPIRDLQKEMENIEKNSFIPKDIGHSSTEIRSLALSFYEMSKRIKSLMNDIVEEQELKRKIELEALQAKINPHFLYNTLDSVIWFAEQENYIEVIEVVNALARLFRISISKGHEIITLQEELEHVKNYLIIQQKRYVDKFTFDISLPTELQHKPVIKLIVQPIVENSIYHGIKYLMDPGFISIKVSSDTSNDIFITVKDNGIGMDEKKCKTLLTTNKKIHDKEGNGIGVFNVNKRLKLAYGETYGLSIESELDEGTSVTIRIPCEKEIKPIKGVQT